MSNWEESILSIRDEYTNFRLELTKYLNRTTKFNGYRFFWEMLPMLRFVKNSGKVAWTNEAKEIYLNIPHKDIINENEKWEFIYYHECLHQMFETFEIEKRIKSEKLKYNHDLLNVASDCVINEHLKSFCNLKYPTTKLITPEYLKEKYQIEYDPKKDDQFTLYVKLLEKEDEIMDDPLVQQERKGALAVDAEMNGSGHVKTKKVKTTDEWKKGSKEARKIANDVLLKIQKSLNKAKGELLTPDEAINMLNNAIPEIQKLLKNAGQSNTSATAASNESDSNIVLKSSQFFKINEMEKPNKVAENIFSTIVLNSSDFVKLNEAEEQSAEEIQDGLKTYDEGWNYAIGDVINQIKQAIQTIAQSSTKDKNSQNGGKQNETNPSGGNTTKSPTDIDNYENTEQIQTVPENDPTEERPFLPKIKSKSSSKSNSNDQSDDDNQDNEQNNDQNNDQNDPSKMTSQQAADSAKKDAQRADKAAQQAEQKANDVENDPASSQSDIADAKQDAKDARDAANKAKRAADAAQKAASNGNQKQAQQEAQNAKDAADEAEAKAGQSKSTSSMTGREAANSAKRDAQRADKAAQRAEQNANKIKNDSSSSSDEIANAQQSAKEARDAANEAQRAADAAQDAAAKGDQSKAQQEAQNAKDAADEAETKAKDTELSGMSANEAASSARKDAQKAERDASKAEQAANNIKNNSNASSKDISKAEQNAKQARDAANEAKRAADAAQKAADNNDKQTAQQEAKNAKDAASKAGSKAIENESLNNNAQKQTKYEKPDLSKSNKSDTSKVKDAEQIDNPNEDGLIDWNEDDRDDSETDPKGWGNEVAEIQAYAKKIGEMSTEEANKIIKRFSHSTDNVLKDFAKKCEKSETPQRGIIVQTKMEKRQYSWAHQFSDVIKNTVKQHVRKRTKEYEETYRRPNRRQGVVHDNDIIKKGHMPVKDRMTISMAFYVDCSGSMRESYGSSNNIIEENIFKFIYELSDVIMKKYHKNPVIDGCIFDTYAFNEQVKRIKKPNVPMATGGTLPLDKVMKKINEYTGSYMINVVITDAEMDFQIEDIKNELRSLAGLLVFITNNDGTAKVLSPLDNIVTTKKTQKFKFIKAPGNFNISAKDFSQMKD